MKIKKYLLIIILIVAAVLRLWRLGSIPPSLTPDEASLGYNAFSILKTGKDEYGTPLPIIFKSFGDYTPGLYVYLTVPFVAVLGLNELAVRLPNALGGVFVVYLLYLLTKKSSKQFGLVVAFLAATNPWLIYFSRGAWLPNVSLALTLIGIYFFLKSIDRTKYIVHSAIFFALTLLSYQGAKLSTGIVLLILALVFWKEVVKIEKKYYLRGFILGLIITLPIIASLFEGKTGRLNVVSIFSYSRSVESVQKLLNEGNEKIGGLTHVLYHSEGLNYLRAILGRWFNNYSGRFLFFEGDWEHPRFGALYMGVMLFSDIILIIAGLSVVIKNLKNKYVQLLLLLLILSPLPSAFSRDIVHAARSLNMIIPLIIISSLGAVEIFKAHHIFFIPFLALTFLSFVYFLDAYFMHLPIHNAKYWDYGYREVVETILPIQSNYQKIVFQQSYEQPFIYFLFYGAQKGYQAYMPEQVQKRLVLKDSSAGDVGLVEQLDNINFRFVGWPITEEEKTLIIVDGVTAPKEIIGSDYKFISQIMYPDKVSTAFNIIEVKKK